MPSAEPELADLLAVAVEAAWAGGRRSLGYFQAGVAVERKPDGSAVTVADRAAEDAVRAVVDRHFPADGFVGEEGGERPGTTGRRWIVDPIDGTASFVRGVPLFGTQVAVASEGEMVVGAVYLPAMDEMVAAARGLGCAWNGRRCRVSTVATIEKSLVLYTAERALRRYPGWKEVVTRAELSRTWADTYGAVLVATGRAEAFLAGPGNALWDVAPLGPIVAEAGGRLSDLRGGPWPPGGDLMVSNGLVHDEVLALLGQDGRTGDGGLD